jgi:amino acid adenylation domain-containing protein
VVEEWNATQAVYPQERCVHELFEEQVEKSPEAVAVVYEDQQVSYGELNRRANQLGHHLRGLGVGPETRVAICVERSVEMVIGLLGALKAGGAYVPLDPSYPTQRLAYMLEDSAPAVLLIHSAARAALAGYTPEARIIDLDADAPLWATLNAQDSAQMGNGLEGNNVAYIIYTSGSTGLPKGVVVEHRSLVNLMHWHRKAFQLTAADRSSCVASFGFDAAAWEIWPTLCTGANLLLPADETARDPERLLKWWQAQAIDVSFLPTPIAEYAFARGICNRNIRMLLVGGDRWQRSAQPPKTISLVNNYGPTETTVVATSGCLEAGDRILHIGRPICNTRIYIQDVNWEPGPMGVSGEMYIGGAGVARGYLNRAELTAKRFLPDPYSQEPGARVYRTGDVGRWLPEGRIEFVGRNDFQVKVRGFRIELGEIEARLITHPEVREAVVLAREEEGGGKRLLAYYTGADVGAESLRAHLSESLPEYMVPAAYVHLEAMPLTANGKLDRRALPAASGDAYVRREYEEPVGEIEKAVARIWSELLGVERVSRHDNFFELGGHSLLIVTMIERLQCEGLHADVRTLFIVPTPAELASSMEYVEVSL